MDRSAADVRLWLMPDPRQGRVLIIDDDPGDGELAVRRLRLVGAKVDFHQGPDASIEAVRRGEYDVVILDVTMPGVGGLEILRQIREQLPTVRVMLYSAMDPDALAEVGRAHGVAVLNKSSARTEFIRRVRELLAAGSVS